MTVVSFCGGYGVRMRAAESDVIHKPLQMFGPRSLLWWLYLRSATSKVKSVVRSNADSAPGRTNNATD